MTRIALPVIFLFVLALSPLASATDPDRSPFTLQVAALLPLTGGAAEQGEWLRRGLVLGAQKAQADEGVAIQFVFEDTVGDPKHALAAYTKLQFSQKPSVIFTYGSGVGVTLTPLFNRDKIIQMGIATATPKYRTIGDYTFRNFPSADAEAVAIVSLLRETLLARRIGIIKIENDYGISSAKAVREGFLDAGGTVEFEESVAPAETDMRGMLTRVKKYNPDILFLAVLPSEGAQLIRQARQLGITTRMVASVGLYGGTDFFKRAGTTAEGLIIASSTPLLTGSERSDAKEFLKRYQDTYAKPPAIEQITAVRAYDAVRIVGKVATVCRSDTRCMRDQLLQLKEFEGLSGSLSFDEAGDIASAFNFLVVRGEAFIPYTPDRSADLNTTDSREVFSR